ncbi:PIG-L deacetylase family protein [Thiovibrio sp. JS02]
MKNSEEFSGWLDYVNRFAAPFLERLGEEGRVAGGADKRAGSPRTDVKPRRILLCSPHPDDEALVGGLPLRMLKETGARVTNVAVTLGSDTSAAERRLAELRRSCEILGFALELAGGGTGFTGVTPWTRGQEPARWQGMVEQLCALFCRLRPDLVVFPHNDDMHPTHVGVHHLVLAALRRYSEQEDGVVITAESEYWHPLAAPNCLLGLAAHDVARLLSALAAHGGEVKRHPYHLFQPARLIDNVRRGAERVGGFGAGVPSFLFGELYRLGRFSSGLREFAQPLLVAPGVSAEAAIFSAAFAFL